MTSMDVVVGYEVDPFKMWIFRNLDLVGNSWAIVYWSGGTSTIYNISANGEYKIKSYLPPGMDYTDTVWTGTGYEDVYKVESDVTVQSQARNYIGGAPSISPTQGLSWTDPSASSFYPALPTTFSKVTFSTYYYTSAGGGTFKVGTSPTTLTVTIPGDTTRTITTISTASATLVPVTFELTNWVPDLNTLTNLQFQITNNLSKGTVWFGEWVIEVEYGQTIMTMDHIWTFSDVKSGSNTLYVYANVSDVPGHDTFDLSYSTDNITYTKIGSIITTTKELHQFILPFTEAQAIVYIRATNSNILNPQNTTLRMGAMCIYNVYSETATGTAGAITSIQVYDMDNDGYPDIIVSDSTNVWVLLNDQYGTYTLPANVARKQISGSTIRTVAAGIFAYGDPLRLPDIAVATDSGIYILNHTARTAYSDAVMGTGLNGVIVNKPLDACMQGGDIDGDGDTDLLVAWGNTIVLYINGGATGFRSFTIEVVDSKDMIQTLFLGKTTG